MKLPQGANRLLVLAMVAFAFAYYVDTRGPARAPGVLAPNDPTLTPVAAGAPSYEKLGYRIVPLAAIALEARVLGVQRYYTGRQADLSPLDVVFGWGPLSDSAVLATIDTAQDRREYFWTQYANAPTKRDIERHSANMHLIPADESIERTLKKLRPGHVVKLSGYVVEVYAGDGWKWAGPALGGDAAPGSGQPVWVNKAEMR